MDPYTVGGMIFSLVMVVLIGSFIVTFPILRRLGALMEESIRERRDARLQQGDLSALREQLSALASSVHSLERHVETLDQRQGFVEELLERSERAALPGDRRPRETGG